VTNPANNARMFPHTPYAPRPVRFLDLWSMHGYRLKVYGIAHARPLPRPELVEAARIVVARHLRERPTRQDSYGVGFVGIHDGRGENQVFLDRWVNENELLHHYYVSTPDDPAALAAAANPDDHNSVCVWDLGLQAFEREAWLKHVLRNPDGADLEGYLAARLNADL
jgi:hypothetical protein